MYKAAAFAIFVVLVVLIVLISISSANDDGIPQPNDTQSTTSQGDGTSGDTTADLITSDSTEATSAPETTAPDTTAPETAPETTAPETTALAANFEYQTMTEADVHKGYLILVNYQNAFTFDTDFVIQPFYGNRNNSYKLRDTLVSLDAYAMDWCNQMMAAFEAETGYHDILVNSAYRTLEEQEEIYSSRVEDYGEEYAKNYVAVPGYSEHHTGLAIDFTIYTDDNESKTFDDMTDYPLWLSENGHRFGYIQRYPSDKVDITKINYENWHYRYVGKPHA